MDDFGARLFAFRSAFAFLRWLRCSAFARLRDERASGEAVVEAACCAAAADGAVLGLSITVFEDKPLLAVLGEGRSPGVSIANSFVPCCFSNPSAAVGC